MSGGNFEADGPPLIVLATHNPHKVDEIRAILGPLLPGLAEGRVVGARDFDVPEPVEDEVTFAGNALVKARHLAKATGLIALADDSGIVVDVLGGAPGVFSARWCGEHGRDADNLALLLAQLADVPERHRGAAFVCAAAMVAPGGTEVVSEGRLRGSLLAAPRGDGGFGYDPIFRAEGHDASLAELTPSQKSAISHRGRAFRALAPRVRKELDLAHPGQRLA